MIQILVNRGFGDLTGLSRRLGKLRLLLWNDSALMNRTSQRSVKHGEKC